YAIGYNLLSSEKRNSTYISDWNRVVYVDKEVKIVQPVSIQGYGGNRLSYANDEAIPAAKLASVTRSKQPALIQTIQDLTKFLDKKPPPK
ncbi:MAG: sulfatase-like hydrolase/transferase, partial [Methylophilaceae bacterium]